MKILYLKYHAMFIAHCEVGLLSTFILKMDKHIGKSRFPSITLIIKLENWDWFQVFLTSELGLLTVVHIISITKGRHRKSAVGIPAGQLIWIEIVKAVFVGIELEILSRGRIWISENQKNISITGEDEQNDEVR